jgi:DNA replication protein DnaC
MTGEMLKRRFETYPGTSESQLAAKGELESFCKEVEAGIIPERGICLYGDTDQGKSGLLQATVNRILSMPNPPGIVFVDCSDLNSYSDRRIDVQYAVSLAKIVVLDDFEKGLDSPDVFKESHDSQWIKSLFRRADREREFTVMASTNYPIEAHRERFGAALTRREGALMHWIKVEGSGHLSPRAEEVPYWAE